jgi:3-oxoadipate enol-lactonase
VKPSCTIVLPVLLAAVLFAVPLTAQAPVALKNTEFGRGPTLVFLHGLGGARMEWMPTARRLLGRYRVLLVDLPGHGDSPLPDPFSFEACAAALDQLLAKQKAESTIVVAHGAGGVVLAYELQKHPERMQGVVLIDAQLKSPVAIPDQQKKYFLQYLEESPENLAQFVKATYTRMGRDSTQGVAIHAQAAQVAPATMKAYLRTLLYVDIASAFEKHTGPKLFIISERGWPAGRTWSDAMKNYGFADSTAMPVRRIGNSGYLIMNDQPDSLATAISEFAQQAMAAKK